MNTARSCFRWLPFLRFTFGQWQEATKISTGVARCCDAEETYVALDGLGMGKHP